MQGASGAKALMDGVIAAVAHDEFRGMGLSGVRRFVDEGAVLVDVGGMFDAGEVKRKGFYYRRL